VVVVVVVVVVVRGLALLAGCRERDDYWRCLQVPHPE